MRKTIKFSKVNKSYKQPIQAAGFDAEAFKARHKAAQERSAAKKSGRAIVDQIKESEDPIAIAFELLVPGSGKADTVAGEMIRAMMRIMYRDFNDGDLFYEGYGVETCGDAVAYLCDKIPDLEDKFEDIAMRQLRDDRYTNAIKAISKEVLAEIYANPNLAAEPNSEDMFDFDGEEFIKDREWEPKYEFECELPDNVAEHIRVGNISDEDLRWELESWDIVSNGDVECTDYWVRVSDLNRDDYDELENSMYQWLENYGDDLDAEYGVPGEEDEDEEYEEDEE